MFVVFILDDYSIQLFIMVGGLSIKILVRNKEEVTVVVFQFYHLRVEISSKFFQSFHYQKKYFLKHFSIFNLD